MDWNIGCSGFYYNDWKGIFYPEKLPQKKWFEFYTTQFNTLELNSTFYSFPKISSLNKWYETSPVDFKFAVKAPRLITHYKRFNDCSRLIGDFYKLISEGLKEKLGPVLYQLPPKFNYTASRLDLILDELDKSFTNVIEFRDSSWWDQKIFTRMKRENVIFCGINYPKLPTELIITNKTAYYRFHGVPKLYYSAHKTKELKNVADTIATDKKVNEAYVFFNNTATIAAIKNAMWLKKYLLKNYSAEGVLR